MGNEANNATDADEQRLDLSGLFEKARAAHQAGQLPQARMLYNRVLQQV